MLVEGLDIGFMKHPDKQKFFCYINFLSDSDQNLLRVFYFLEVSKRHEFE